MNLTSHAMSETSGCGTSAWSTSIFKLCLHAAVFEAAGASVSVCARVTLFVDDAYVFAREAADSSDLGRLLSCWKHTAAHQIFTAPSNSRLHVGCLRLARGCWLQTVGEERKTYQHRSPRCTTNTREGQAHRGRSFGPSCTGEIWPHDFPFYQ